MYFRFVKIYDRGERNQCSRTDYTFKPLPESNLAKKRRTSHSNPQSSCSTTVIKEEKVTIFNNSIDNYFYFINLLFSCLNISEKTFVLNLLALFKSKLLE